MERMLDKTLDLAEVRRKLGLSIQQFALAVGVREYTVERWKRGESHPSPLALSNISFLLKQHDAPQAAVPENASSIQKSNWTPALEARIVALETEVAQFRAVLAAFGVTAEGRCS